MSDDDWDADDFQPRDVKAPPGQWQGEDDESLVSADGEGRFEVSDSTDIKGDSSLPLQKKKNKLLKERLAEKDEQFKKEFEEKQKLQLIAALLNNNTVKLVAGQENLSAKTRTQKIEERKRQSKLKEAANLESALEAFGLGKDARDEDIKTGNLIDKNAKLDDLM